MSINTQKQLDLFARLAEGVDIPAQDLLAILELLQLIEQDEFFTRAWILQESTSAGLEMTLLIQHGTTPNKPEVLGTIEGDELTIFEYMTAMSFAYACVSLCDGMIDAHLEAQLYGIIDRLTSYAPLGIEDYEGVSVKMTIDR